MTITVTINQNELHKEINNHDAHHNTTYLDLETGGWYRKMRGQWEDVPHLAIPIPCFNPDGSSAEYEHIQDHLKEYLTPEQFEMMEEYQDENGINFYDIMEELDQKSIPGLENVKPPIYGWVEGWEDTKGILIEFMADQWLESLKKNDWQSLHVEMNLMPDSPQLEEIGPVEIEIVKSGLSRLDFKKQRPKLTKEVVDSLTALPISHLQKKVKHDQLKIAIDYLDALCQWYHEKHNSHPS
jgi:hypothetical protein